MMSFIIGLTVGGFAGVSVMCLIIISAIITQDDYEE